MKKRTFLKFLMGLSGGILFGASVYAAKSRSIAISHETISLPNLNTKLRVVAVSDVHMLSWNSPPGQLIALINSQEPDIFLLAGDIVDKIGYEDRVEIFKDVKARVAKFATLGNWEHLGELSLEKLYVCYQAAGIELLVNQSVNLEQVTIIGFDDWVVGSVDYEHLRKYFQKGFPYLVISHCPAVFDRLSADLDCPFVVISGHTHGGQISPFGIVLVTPRGSGTYVRGWYHRRNGAMYVMRGIGTTPGIPIRIGAHPEILRLDLLPA